MNNNLSIYVGDSKELFDEVEKEAERLDRSVSWLIKHALKKYLEVMDNDG